MARSACNQRNENDTPKDCQFCNVFALGVEFKSKTITNWLGRRVHGLMEVANNVLKGGNHGP